MQILWHLHIVTLQESWPWTSTINIYQLCGKPNTSQYFSIIKVFWGRFMFNVQSCSIIPPLAAWYLCVASWKLTWQRQRRIWTKVLLSELHLAIFRFVCWLSLVQCQLLVVEMGFCVTFSFFGFWSCISFICVATSRQVGYVAILVTMLVSTKTAQLMSVIEVSFLCHLLQQPILAKYRHYPLIPSIPKMSWMILGLLWLSLQIDQL